MKDQATVLIVDDELLVRRLLGDALSAVGYHVRTAADQQEAMAALANAEPDLMLLDLRLGDDDGIALLRLARQQCPELPVVILTAHGSLPSAIEALRHEVADYLLKPIGIEELRKRIASVLERARTRKRQTDVLQHVYQQLHSLVSQEPAVHVRSVGESTNNSPVNAGPVQIDIAQHVVRMHGQPIELTPTEFAILHELCRQPGVVISCAQLMHASQQVIMDEDEARAVIRPHIVRLRRKLEADPQQPSHLISVRGVGYRWAIEGEKSRLD